VALRLNKAKAVIYQKGVKLVSASKACTALVCTRNDLKRFRDQGMPATKINGIWYYDILKCHAWFRGEIA
jgi:hypothetical protein